MRHFAAAAFLIGCGSSSDAPLDRDAAATDAARPSPDGAVPEPPEPPASLQRWLVGDPADVSRRPPG
jgi:hypothetical protein